MMKHWRPGIDGYDKAAERVFAFMRHHADDAYSSATMMALAVQAQTGEVPILVVDEEDVEVDRLTEVKRGGVRTAAAVLRDGRVLLATHPRFRRQGYGAAMLSTVRRQVHEQDGLRFQVWVNNRNLDAQRFLLAQGFEMTATTPNAICYGQPSRANWPL